MREYFHGFIFSHKLKYWFTFIELSLLSKNLHGFIFPHKPK